MSDQYQWWIKQLIQHLQSFAIMSTPTVQSVLSKKDNTQNTTTQYPYWIQSNTIDILEYGNILLKEAEVSHC